VKKTVNHKQTKKVLFETREIIPLFLERL